MRYGVYFPGYDGWLCCDWTGVVFSTEDLEAARAMAREHGGLVLQTHLPAGAHLVIVTEPPEEER